MSNTIIITGSSGFIGSALSKRLMYSTDPIHIIGIDNMNDYYDVSLKEYRLHSLEEAAEHTDCKFTFVKADIADKECMMQLFEQYRPDIAVNLAAQAGVRYSIDNPDAYISSNIIGFYNILEACRHYPVRHLVYASSSSVYGGNKKVRIFRNKKNLGSGRTRNLEIKDARGKYIWFVDSDDAVVQNALEKLYNASQPETGGGGRCTYKRLVRN